MQQGINMGKKRFFEPWIPQKIILLSLAFLCMSAMAGEQGVTFLFTNGQKASFTFASSPKIAVGSDGITLSSSTAPSVSYTFANVQRYYFEDNIETGVQSVSSETMSNPVFSYCNDLIAVGGLKAADCVNVYSIGGSKVGETKADADGRASVDISGLANEVYVVGTSRGVSFKLLKR